MNRNIYGSVLILLLLAGLTPLPAQNKGDLNVQQSPTKPEPKDLLFIDQGQFDPRLKGYVTPDGFKLEIVAEAPTVINPVGMTFGPDGSLFVLEWIPPKGSAANSSESQVEFAYKDGSKRKVAIVRKPTKDWVKLLSDTKGKGIYDQARVVLHDELPSSILVHDDWIYLSGQGTVRRYPLAQALKESQDGKRDFTPQIVAQGFGGLGHHQVSGLTIGNEGWLYITAGDGDNYVEGSDGSRATVLRTGAIFRCRADGAKVHTFALGFCNPYREVAFDKAFNMFHADNGNADGSKFAGSRLMHVPEGVDFGWRLRAGSRCCVPDNGRAAVHGELPGKLAPMLRTGRGTAAGLLIYNDTYLPEKYRGWLLYPDAFRKLIRAYQVEPMGATFEITHEFALLKAADPLFRPCQMVLGPDGAMYICDTRSDLSGGKLWGDGKHGRIYRMTWAGTNAEPAIPTRGMDSWADILKQSDADLLKTLESENFSDRQNAQRELVRRGDKQRKPLLALLADSGKPAHAHLAALGALQAFWNGEVKDGFIAQLKYDNTALRRLCADGLALNCARGDKDVHAAIEQHLNEDNPAVLRALFIAIGKVGAPGAANAIVNALQFDESKDAHLRDGMARGLEDAGKDGFQQLMALANSGELKELERVVEIYPAFRTRAAGESLGTLIKSYHLTPAQRVALIRSYNNYQLDPPLPLQPLSDYLAQLDMNPPKGSTPADLVPVKLAGLQVLANNRALNTDKARALLLGMLREKNADVRASVIKLAADARVTQAIPQLVDMLGKSEAQAERLVLVRALGALPGGKSQDEATWSAVELVLKAKDAEPALRLEAFRTLEALDMGRSKKHAEALLSDPDAQVQREAVVQLGRDAEGARLAGRHFIENKLPRSLLPLVADGLRRFAREDAESAWLLGEVMKSADKK